MIGTATLLSFQESDMKNLPVAIASAIIYNLMKPGCQIHIDSIYIHIKQKTKKKQRKVKVEKLLKPDSCQRGKFFFFFFSAVR